MIKSYTKHQQKSSRISTITAKSISHSSGSGELVTELYLAEGKGRERQWKYIVVARWKNWPSGGPGSRASAEARQPGLAREVVEELMAKAKVTGFTVDGLSLVWMDAQMLPDPKLSRTLRCPSKGVFAANLLCSRPVYGTQFVSYAHSTSS